MADSKSTANLAYVTPAVVAWALAKSTLPRESIASSLGVSEADLASWEQPDGPHPPWDKATALADLLDVPFGFFYLSAPPDRDARSDALSIDVRHATLDDGTVEFDEIFAKGAYVHLEKMNKSQFCLIVETAEERACFFIGAKRAPVDAWEMWREGLATGATK